jgi:hypothetical protein
MSLVSHQVPGENAELFFKSFCEMAEIGKAYLAAGLFDAALAGDQHFLGSLEPVLIIIVIQGVSVYLFEKILQLAGAHKYFMRQ